MAAAGFARASLLVRWETDGPGPGRGRGVNVGTHSLASFSRLNLSSSRRAFHPCKEPVRPIRSSTVAVFNVGSLHRYRYLGCRAQSLQNEISSEELPERWDVVGLGQAMVDFSCIVGDDFLERLKLEKGVRKVVSHDERGDVFRALDGRSFKASAGGSLSNTLVALARLGKSQGGWPSLNVAMAGSVGKDPLGDFFRAKLLKANVHFLSSPIVDGTTGTVIVLTTPDAQRAMMSYQGMSSLVKLDATLEKHISTAKVLVVEGYLWEISQTVETIAQACKIAHENGVIVALTACDVSCVTRYREQFWDVMTLWTDMLFANSDEAKAICGFSSSTSSEYVAGHLSQFCPLVSVTDGAHGSFIGLEGEALCIPSESCVAVDTCGAGDAYAAGMLYGLLRGSSDLLGTGRLAARVAAKVVGQQGTRLKVKDAFELASSFHAHSDLEDQAFELAGIGEDAN